MGVLGAKDAGTMVVLVGGIVGFVVGGEEETERDPLRPGKGISSGFGSEAVFFLDGLSPGLLDEPVFINEGPSSRSGFFKSTGVEADFVVLLGGGGSKSSGSLKLGIGSGSD